MMSDDTKELKTIEDQAKARPLSVSDDADETTVLHSPDNETAAETEVLPTAADAVETSALPVVDDSIDETRPMTTAADGSATTVIPSADDNQESEDIVSDDREKTIPLEVVADTSIPPASDIPLYAAGNVSSGNEQTASGTSPNAEFASSAQPVDAQSQSSTRMEPAKKSSISTLTVVFGLLGVLIGALGLFFGVTFPDMLITQFAADPQVLVAIVCAIVGVVLVAIAIVWAIMGTVKKK